MSANGNGHHWSKFCWARPADDKASATCSLAARGLWMEMLASATPPRSRDIFLSTASLPPSRRWPIVRKNEAA